MKISVCITTLNEEKTIENLINSLLDQTRKPDEIIIVDGVSKDKTLEIIKHFQKKDNRIRFLQEKCSRARGRNLSVDMANNEIIAMTDAGCIARSDWLDKISEPFKRINVNVVAGFYMMKSSNEFEKAESVYLGVIPQKFDINFLPSARSIAFKKKTWEEVGGFPEGALDTAEDTIFNYKLLKANVKFSRMKNAIVEWGMPLSLNEFYTKIESYAEGDARSKIWLYPGKGFASHNIKALTIFARYFLFLFLIFISLFSNQFVFLITFVLISLYLLRAYKKARIWGPILQVVSDFAVMKGFIKGII